jgi:hypothetical protein
VPRQGQVPPPKKEPVGLIISGPIFFLVLVLSRATPPPPTLHLFVWTLCILQSCSLLSLNSAKNSPFGNCLHPQRTTTSTSLQTRQQGD